MSRSGPFLQGNSGCDCKVMFLGILAEKDDLFGGALLWEVRGA